jgi:hypothetical protein
MADRNKRGAFHPQAREPAPCSVELYTHYGCTASLMPAACEALSSLGVAVRRWCPDQGAGPQTSPFKTKFGENEAVTSSKVASIYTSKRDIDTCSKAR